MGLPDSQQEPNQGIANLLRPIHLWLLEVRNFLCNSTDCEPFKKQSVLYKAQLDSCLEGKKLLIDKVEEKKVELKFLTARVIELEEELGKWMGQSTGPETSGKISMHELSEILKPHTKQLFLSDSEYTLALVESMRDFLRIDPTDRYKYQTIYYDCDDFSYRLMGQASTPEWAAIAFGIAWSKSHAFNIFVSASKQVYIIEPQSDKVIKLEDATGAYSNLQLVVM